jgi:hypothetical protein
MSQDPLRDVQDSIKAVLTAQPWFAGIDIITEQKGDVLNRIDIALGKLGLCIVIETLTGKPEAMGSGAYTLELSVGITITENVIINQGSTGSKKPASMVVAMILCLLSSSRPLCPAYCTGFTLVNDSAGLLIYQINGKASAGFKLT